MTVAYVGKAAKPSRQPIAVPSSTKPTMRAIVRPSCAAKLS